MFQRIALSQWEREQQKLLTDRAEERATLQRILAEAVRNTVQAKKIKNDDRTAR